MEAEHIRTGRIGEVAVANHFKRRGFVLVETNYRKKWGEIDVIMSKAGTIHFIEVKTVSCDTGGRVPRDTWQPEERVDARKLRRLMRTIETWLLDRAYDGSWQVDVAVVRIDPGARRGRIKVIDNVIPAR